MPVYSNFRFLLLLSILGLGACSVAPQGTLIHDPYEDNNRGIHTFNKDLDRLALRPASQIYDAVLPDPVETGISNIATNLSLPGKIVNHSLQGDFEGAGNNLLRFAINTTAGIGGLFDPADTYFSIEEIDTDFGETLAVWGVPEGAYLELPLYGPSSERAAAGIAVDFVLDPLSYIIPSPESTYRTGARVGEILQKRHDRDDDVNSVLYQSADSYAQARLIYLQNRRFSLEPDAGTEVNDLFIEPYFDPYE